MAHAHHLAAAEGLTLITGVGDISAQTHQVCQNLKAAIEAAGGTLDDIARVDVYPRDMAGETGPRRSAVRRHVAALAELVSAVLTRANGDGG